MRTEHDASGKTSRDARDLRRGATANVLGYALRGLHPVMLALATQVYGVALWGIYVAGEAAVRIALRACLLGYSRGLAYWVPIEKDGQPLTGVRGALITVGTLTVAFCLLMAAFGATVLAGWWNASDAAPALVIMSAGIVPAALNELLIHATVGRRRMDVQVIASDVVPPFATVGSALVLHAFGVRATGLAWAFVIGHSAGLAVSAYAFRRIFAGTLLAREWRPPAELRRYARPLWGSDMLYTFTMRLDTLVLAAFADPLSVGVYGVVTQFGNTVRSIRVSFDSMVVAMVSGVSKGGAQRAGRRLAEGFSYATTLVLLTQLPVVAFMLAFSGWLLPLFGEGFEQGETAVTIVCVFWALNGFLGLSGQVVNGVGGSRATLASMIATLLIGLPLLLILVPQYGVEGAAVGVGLALTAQGLIQVVQMRQLTGAWNYNHQVATVATWSAISFASMAGATWGLGRIADDAVARVGGFAVFLLVFAPLAVQKWRAQRPAKLAPVAGE